VLVVNPELPARSVNELIALAKASPGKFAFASTGGGSTPHLAGEMFRLATNLDLIHVPYKGSAPAIVDLLGGQVDVSIDQLSSAITHLKSGRARAMMVVSAERDPLVPDVPSAKELGLPQLEVSTTAGLLAPGKTPPATLALLNAALNKTLADPQLQEQFTRAASRARPGAAAVFTTLMQTEDKTATALAASGKLKPE
jgi:tripartite-type tricarboxylate transporter receptor subunit TctC